MPPSPEPPLNVPRISKVLSPGDGLYSVYVRMPYNLASKVPDKAWNLTITEIGLAPKDAEKFAGYVLVGFESMKGSPDILWVFESLPGAVWDTVSRSRENLTPQKFRESVLQTKTKQDVLPGTAPDALTDDKILSAVERQENTGKSVKTDITEVIDENILPLVGERFAPDGTILSVSEQLVVDGTTTEKGVNVATSEVSALGNGKSVKETQGAKRRTTFDAIEEGWPVKQKKSKGQESRIPAKFRDQVTTTTTRTQETLAASNVSDIPTPDDLTGDQMQVEHEKVNDYRYEKRVTEEVIGESITPLVGQRFAPDGAVIDIEEQLVTEGTSADAGYLIASSDVEALGGGKAIKQTQSVTAWPSKQRKSKGQDSLVPAKYRGLVTTEVTTTQEDLGGADLLPPVPTPSGSETLIELEKINDHRYAKSITTEVIASGSALESEELNRYGTVSTIEESLVADAAALPTPNYLTLKASDTPLGNGKSVREVETVSAFPELVGFKTDRRLDAPVKFTEEIVDATTALTNTDPLVEYEPIDALRTLKRTTVVPTSFLESYSQSFPKRCRLDLPRELVAVSVIWGSTSNIGNQDGSHLATSTAEEWTLGSSGSDDANSSASASPEVQFQFRDMASDSMFSTSYSFFLPMPVTTAAVLAKVSSLAGGSVAKWPVFRPESHTITATAQSVGLRVSASAAASQTHRTDSDDTSQATGTSDNINCSIEHSSIQIPPCIHGAISFGGVTEMTIPVMAQAGITISGVISASALISRSSQATGSVSPTFLSATEGQNTIPTSGLYLMDVDAEPYQWGYAMVRAEVFDASDLAPS